MSLMLDATGYHWQDDCRQGKGFTLSCVYFCDTRYVKLRRSPLLKGTVPALKHESQPQI